MKLKINDLTEQLRKKLKPLFLLTGDEPFQLIESANLIRQTIQSQGYLQREIIEVTPKFNWDDLTLQLASPSLFAEKRLIELRLKSAKIGVKGSAAFLHYCENIPRDVILMISMPRCDAAQQKSKWFKALEQIGCVVQIWAIEGNYLIDWIWQRFQKAQLQIDNREVAAFLAEHIEGNLLAAVQEIAKLKLLYPNEPIDLDKISQVVSNSARHNVYNLLDTALMGKVAPALRILQSLKAEGMASTLVLWSLAKDIRLLATLSYQIQQGTSIFQAINARRDIFKNRQSLIRIALQRHSLNDWHYFLTQCHEIDLMIKGQKAGDEWLLLNQVLVAVALKK